MEIADYLLRPEDMDPVELLGPWGHLLPDELTVWMFDRFGEAILVLDDGTVRRLSPELGALERLAASREAFHDGVDANADDWLRIRDVDAAVAAGLVLGPGQCYGFTVPLLLGGERSLDNLRVWDVLVYWSFLADVHAGTRDLPDGSRVRLRPRP